MSPQFCQEQIQTPYFLECVCMHSNRKKNLLFSHCMLFSQPPKKIYFHIMYTNFVSNWFKLVLSVRCTDRKMRIAISGRKENHSSIFFKVPWQHNIQNFKFDENSRRREADYKKDNLLLLWQEHQRLIALCLSLTHARAHCVIFLI